MDIFVTALFDVEIPCGEVDLHIIYSGNVKSFVVGITLAKAFGVCDLDKHHAHNKKHYADNKYRQEKWETSALYVACVIIFCHYATAFELTNLWTKFVNLLKRLTQPRHMHLITGITIMPPSPIQISPAPIRAMPAG